MCVSVRLMGNGKSSTSFLPLSLSLSLFLKHIHTHTHAHIYCRLDGYINKNFMIRTEHIKISPSHLCPSLCLFLCLSVCLSRPVVILSLYGRTEETALKHTSPHTHSILILYCLCQTQQLNFEMKNPFEIEIFYSQKFWSSSFFRLLKFISSLKFSF
jgi:hypothetical protein